MSKAEQDEIQRWKDAYIRVHNEHTKCEDIKGKLREWLEIKDCQCCTG